MKISSLLLVSSLILFIFQPFFNGTDIFLKMVLTVLLILGLLLFLGTKFLRWYFRPFRREEKKLRKLYVKLEKHSDLLRQKIERIKKMPLVEEINEDSEIFKLLTKNLDFLRQIESNNQRLQHKITEQLALIEQAKKEMAFLKFLKNESRVVIDTNWFYQWGASRHFLPLLSSDVGQLHIKLKEFEQFIPKLQQKIERELFEPITNTIDELNIMEVNGEQEADNRLDDHLLCSIQDRSLLHARINKRLADLTE